MNASVYFIYHADDQKIAEGYTNALREMGLNVITDEFDNSSKPLLKVNHSHAGGYLLLISEYSLQSPQFNPILVSLLELLNKDITFLIPLISGNAGVPTGIQHLSAIQITGEDYTKISTEIKTIIGQWTTYWPLEGSLASQSASATSAAISYKDQQALNALKQLDLITSDIDTTNRFAVMHAVIKFQKDNGIWTTGVWDEITEEKALELLNMKTSDNIKSGVGTAEININYWFLKIYGDHWNLPSVRTGDEMYFHTTFNSFEKRPDYTHFTSVKAGDKGCAFDYSSLNAIVFLFEVIAGKHLNDKNEEVISFKIIHFLNPGVELFKLVNFLPFIPKLSKEELERLFPLTEKQYRTIESLIEGRPIPEIMRVFAKSSITNVISDSPSKEIRDELDFESDVNAFAAIMAYREVKPPLAIGLFGNWGSGKSFFMNKLQSRIEQLQSSGENEFCKHILHISFNSWHYSDSNLWASLITKIFDELHRHGKDQPTELSKLIEQLHSTKELLEKKKTDKKIVEDEVKKLEEEKKVYDERIKKESDALQNLSFAEIAGGLMNDTEVQKDFQKLKDTFSFLDLEELDDVKLHVEELGGVFHRLRKSLTIAWKFLWGKDKLFALLLAILIAVGTWALLRNSMLVKEWVPWLKHSIVWLSALLAGYTTAIAPAFKYINNAYTRLTSLDRTVGGLKEYARKKFIEEENRLQQNINEAKSNVESVEDKISLLRLEEEKLQTQIDDIVSGKMVLQFIEKKVMDERYINSLGIISWVRRDFEELDRLIEQHREAQKTIEEGIVTKDAFNLERIILYIDDLDRCNEAIVVKVLEAIHLLLAFPLFVVVVGVDPRWMHKALNERYSKFLLNTQINAGLESDNGNETPEIGNPATSYDYLEKIFQIPFVLKTMTEAGRHRLIRSQLQSSVDDAVLLVKDIQLTTEPNQSDTNSKESLPKTDIPVHEPESVDHVVIPLTDSIKQKNISSDKVKQEYLKISEDEIKFIEKISFLMGNSPRTIKRYLNTYRIIRTHAGFQLESEQTLKYYFSAIVLLAIITGIPNESESFFRELRSEPPADYFSIFISRYVEKNERCSDKIKALSTLIEKKADSQANLLNGLTLDIFHSNINLVSRFTFRNV